MNIGDTLQKVRKEKGISQKDLSLKCGLSQTSISQIEKGVTFPSQSTIIKLCESLEIPPALLFLLSLEESEIPDNKKEKFNLIFPSLKSLALKLIE